MASLTEFYFRPKAIELNGKLYVWLGVLWFKRGLMSLLKPDPERPTANAYVLGSRTMAGLSAFEKRTRRSEAIHLGGLGLAVVCLLLGAFGGGTGITTAGLIVFAANFHCCILQRYNRIRIDRVLRRAHTTARHGISKQAE